MAHSINARKKLYFWYRRKISRREKKKTAEICWIVPRKSPHFQNTHRKYRHDRLRSAVNTPEKALWLPISEVLGFFRIIVCHYHLIAQRGNGHRSNDIIWRCQIFGFRAMLQRRCNFACTYLKRSLTFRFLFSPPFLTMEQRRSPATVSAHEDWICTNLLIK